MSKLKKALIIIPCMVVGLFLCSTAKISANEAVLIDGNETYVGDASSKDNKYYFSSEGTWEFKVKDYHAVSDWDTSLKYRVIRPDGKATAWSDFQKYVDNSGKFTINFSTLSYTQVVSVKDRNSVVSDFTYYVDIQYYKQWLGFTTHQKEKDETVKVIVSDNNSLNNIPTVGIEYNPTTNKFVITASTEKEDKAYSILTGVVYFFSTDKVADDDISDATKFTNMAKKNINVAGSIEASSPTEFSSTINGASEEYNYLYVAVGTGNGYFAVGEYNIAADEETEVSDGKDSSATTNNEDKKENKGSGIMDWSFGELMLIVLIVVLFVSCALIITQKIIDYKKRLY